MSRLVPPTAFVLAVALASPALRAEMPIRQVEVGFGGAYKAGEWTPLSVTIGSSGARPESVVVETVTADADGTSVLRRGDPRQVETAGAVHAVFQSGRLGSDLTVRLRSSSGELLAERRDRHDSAALPKALPKGSTLWVTAGGFNTTTEGGLKPALPGPERVVIAPVDRLLSDPLGYAAADLLLVRGDLAPTPEQAAAIRDWVAGGGHLAVALGRHTDAFRAGPLAEWVPLEIGETIQLFDLTRIEAYSRSDQALPRARRVPAARIGRAAQTLLEDEGVKLVARSPYGFGTVTAFAFGLDEAPFRSNQPPFKFWAGLPGVLARALVEEEGGGRNDGAADQGVTDLSTQLLRAEEALPGVDRPTTGRALLLLLLYAAVVGPLDYLLVHRLLRRPALTWLTLPLIAVGAAWWLDRDAVASNGRASQVSQLDLVDVDAAVGTFRGRATVTVYSVASTRAEFSAGLRTEGWGLDGTPAAPHLAWSAPPEEAFGGAFRETSGGLFRSEYTVLPSGAAAKAEHLPVLAGGSRRFMATWRRNDAAALVESDLAARGHGLLEGEVTHHLPGPIHAFIVAFGDRVYYRRREPQWHPDEPIDLGSGAFLRQDLGSYLRRAQTRRIKRKPGEGGQDYVVTEGTYDPLSTDLGEIVRMLTFHRAAGGRAYTGLTNLPLAADDLSPLLDLGRAVVLGRLDTPASEVTVSPVSGPSFETTRRTTFVRLVLPVRRLESQLPAALPTDPDAARSNGS